MNSDETKSALSTTDQEHLKLLAVFHIVFAVGIILFSIFGIGSLYAVTSTFDGLKLHGNATATPFAATKMWMIFVAVIAIFIATSLVFSSHFIRQKRCRSFSIFVASTLCLFAPLGTALGVLTIMVLTRDSVREAYR